MGSITSATAGKATHCIDLREQSSHTPGLRTGDALKSQAAVLEKVSLNSPGESCLSNPSKVCTVLFIFILFSGVDHVSVRLDLETLFQFSHLILTFKVRLLPELLCNVIHQLLNHRHKLLTEAVKASSLEVCKNRLDKHLSTVIKL